MELNAAQLRPGRYWRIVGWGSAALLLLTPLVAMQFTREVNWTAFDFAFAAVIFAIVGLGLEFAFRSPNIAYRAGAVFGLLAGFLLVWLTGAVGIIGSEGNDGNAMYAGVIGVALLGALLARFRAGGLSWAMGAAALAQLAVMTIAIGYDLGTGSPRWPAKLVELSTFFTVLWLVSAGCFYRASRGQRS